MVYRPPYVNGPLGGTPLEADRLNAEETDLQASLAQLSRDPSLLFTGAIIRDADGTPISASVTWPDGSPGIYSGTASTDWPGLIDSYTVTKVGVPTRTFTQPAVTRNAAGFLTNRPPITIS